MTLLTPLWLNESGYTAEDDRILIDAVFSAPGVGPVGTGPLLVTQHSGGANMTVDVAAGLCVVTGTDISDQGKYLCKSDAAFTTAALAAAPGSGNSRIDLICAQVFDDTADGSGLNEWDIKVIEGTPAATGSEVAPSLPASSLVLASILVGPSTSTIVNGDITDERVFAETINSLAGNPCARMYPTGGTGITTGSDLPVGAMVVDYLSGGFTFATSFGDFLTVPQTGKYRVSVAVNFDSGSTTGIYGAKVYVNGSAARTFLMSADPDGFTSIAGSSGIALNDGDTVQLHASSSAQNTNVVPGPGNTWLDLELVSF